MVLQALSGIPVAGIARLANSSRKEQQLAWKEPAKDRPRPDYVPLNKMTESYVAAKQVRDAGDRMEGPGAEGKMGKEEDEYAYEDEEGGGATAPGSSRAQQRPRTWKGKFVEAGEGGMRSGPVFQERCVRMPKSMRLCYDG